MYFESERFAFLFTSRIRFRSCLTRSHSHTSEKGKKNLPELNPISRNQVRSPSGDRGRGVSVLSVVFGEVVVGKKERTRVERVRHLNVHVDVNVYIVEQCHRLWGLSCVTLTECKVRIQQCYERFNQCFSVLFYIRNSIITS